MIHLYILFLASLHQIAASIMPSTPSDLGLPFDNMTITYAVTDSIGNGCSLLRRGARNTSDFGCGVGLDCLSQNRWVSRCRLNSFLSEFLNSQKRFCSFPIKLTGCLPGSYCSRDSAISQCKACRFIHSTCDIKQKEYPCCPGIRYQF